MNKRYLYVICFLFCPAALLWLFSAPTIAQTKANKEIPDSATSDTVIRFFYLPPNSYEHPPLILRVSADDHRLGTAPIVNMGGRTPFISISEMDKLLADLAHSVLSWRQSTVSKPVTPVADKDITDQMEISIFVSDHPVEAYLKRTEICRTLSKFDHAFSVPRALWEFQLFRIQYGCRVAHFKRNLFPQREIE